MRLNVLLLCLLYLFKDGALVSLIALILLSRNENVIL